MRHYEILNELSRPREMEDVEPIMLKAGWEIYGSGYYGQVYGKDDKSYVLKVYDSKDRPYTDFLKLVTANPNPHYPKIFGKPIKVTSQYWALRMEKLIPAKNTLHLDIYLFARDKGPNPRNDLQVEEYGKIMAYLETQPQLKQALDLIIDNLIPPYRSDLHGDNLMKRQDGTLVIIDPIGW